MCQSVLVISVAFITDGQLLTLSLVIFQMSHCRSSVREVLRMAVGVSAPCETSEQFAFNPTFAQSR